MTGKWKSSHGPMTNLETRAKKKKIISAVRQHHSGFTQMCTGVIINTLNHLDYETVNDSIYDEQCIFTQCLGSRGRWMSKGFEVNNAHN